MGIPDLYTIQGTEHIKILLDECANDSPTTSLMKVLHQEHLLEIGRSGFLYQLEYDKVKHLMTNTWIKNTMKFASESKITIEGTQEDLK